MSQQPPFLVEINLALSRARIPLIVNNEQLQALLGSVEPQVLRDALTRLQESEVAAWLMSKCAQAGLGVPERLSQPAGYDDAQARTQERALQRGPRALAEPACDRHERVAIQLPAAGGEAARGRQGEPSAKARAPERLRNRHVYGGSAALCWEEDLTRAGVHTVALEGARATAQRSFDWPNKIRVQMTERELTVVAAVLLGLQGACAFSAHGPSRDKGFTLERQHQKTFVKLMAGGKPVIAVPMPPEDAYQVVALVLLQMNRNAPWMTSTGIIEALKAQFVTGDRLLP